MDASQAQELRLQMETVLLADPAISQAKILNLAEPDASDAIWTAALALSASEDADATVVGRARKALRKHMNALGQKSLVPKNWTVLAKLPTTTTSDGVTVNEQALYDELLGNAPAAGGADETVADKIKRVVMFTLRVEPGEMDMDKSFAQLGGDSITAIETMARCMESGVAFHVLDLLQCETLNKLAEQVASQETPAPGAGQVPQDDRRDNIVNPPPYVPV